MKQLCIRIFLLVVFSSTYSTLIWAQENFITISQQQIDNLGVKLAKLETASQVPKFTAPAKVVVPPEEDFIVSGTLAGLVVKMNAAVGDAVKKGDVLSIINSPDFLTLQSKYLQALGALKLASATYNRDKTLRQEGVVSGRNEQASYSAYTAAQVEVNEVKQLLQLAGMGLAEFKALTNNGRLMNQISIKSPANGQIIERMATAGSHVDPMSPLYRIADLAELWLEINIPQDRIDDIKVGDKVRVENSAAKAVIKVLGQSINPDNQTLLARAVISDNPSSVRVGQKLNVQHMQTSTAITYLLPLSAVIHHEDKTFVFVRDKDGFKVNPVNQLGQQDSGSVISGELTGDENVAIENTSALKAIWLNEGGTN